MADRVGKDAVDVGVRARGYSGGARARLKSASSGSAAAERFDIDAWRNRVTDRLLIAVSAMGAVVVASSVMQAVSEPAWWSQTAPFVAVYVFLLALTLLRGRLNYRIRAWVLLLAGYAVAIMYLAILGLLGNGVVFLLALPALGLIILGIRSGIVMAMLSGALYLLFTAAAATRVMADWLIITENTLAVSQWLGQGLSFGLILVALVVMLAMFNRAQGQALAEARRSAEELAVAHDDLATSSVELDRYARLLETAAGISHEISSVRTRDELLQRAVTLLAERLDLEGVAVYLVEEASAGDGNPTASMRAAPAVVAGPAAGSAPAARTAPVPQVVGDLLKSDWRAMSEREGQAASRPLSDSLSESEGSAELALPLRTGRQLSGVLYVESPKERPLTAREVQSLRLMADQLAVALDNARLFTEVEARLAELSALQRHYTTEAWAGFVQDRPRPEYRWQPTASVGGVQSPSSLVWQEVLDEARGYSGEARGYSGEARGTQRVPADEARGTRPGGTGVHREGTRADEVRDDSHGLHEHAGDGSEKGPVTRYDEETHQHVVAVPVRLRETVIGVLGFHRPRDAGAWQEEEIAAIEAVATRLAFAAENLRLVEQAQRRAASDRLVGQVTARVRETLDMRMVLETAANELYEQLGLDKVTIYLAGEEAAPGDGGASVPADPR